LGWDIRTDTEKCGGVGEAVWKTVRDSRTKFTKIKFTATEDYSRYQKGITPQRKAKRTP